MEEVLTVAAGAFMEVVAVSMAVEEVVSMAVAACGAALPGDFAQKTVAFVAGHRQNATG